MWVTVVHHCMHGQHLHTSACACRLQAAARQAYVVYAIDMIEEREDAHLSLAFVVVSQAGWIKNGLPKVSSLHCQVWFECIRCARYRRQGPASMFIIYTYIIHIYTSYTCT